MDKENVRSMEYCVCVCVSHTIVSDSLQPHGLYVAHQAPLSMEFFRQEYLCGLPFPPPGDLPNPGTEPGSPALQADFFFFFFFTI